MISSNLLMWILIAVCGLVGWIGLEVKETQYTVGAIIVAFICGLKIYLSAISGNPLW